MSMMRKKRGYNRDTPIELVRDYKVFAIACEGSKREPSYFALFQHISGKIKVDVIEHHVSDAEMQTKHDNKSSPQWVLDRAMKYIEKEGLLDEDDLWFVIDKDRWTDEQIRTLAEYCDNYKNWNLVISNPCFEVWLYFHKRKNIDVSGSLDCSKLKSEISKLDKGGYHQYKFLPFLQDAIANAKAADSNPDYYYANINETKVYKLGEALMQVVGASSFENFVSKILPRFVKADIEKAKKSIRRSKK